MRKFLVAAMTVSVSMHASAAHVLVDQTAGSTGATTPSQNFGANQLVQAADAFTVKRQATIRTIVANGIYFNGSGPAASENVTFYTDRHGKPGNPVKSCNYIGAKGADDNGRFTVALKPACKLRKGTYWVSFVVNAGFGGGTSWGWLDATDTGPHQGDWQNPHGPTCPSWEPVHTCFPGNYANGYNYQLLGSGS